MDLPTLHALLAPTGQAALGAALNAAPTPETFLTHLTRLQKQYPAPLAKAALETVILRAKAAAKFSRAARMYFTRDALEQASGERVAQYRAARYQAAGVWAQGTVVDMGCSVGGDTLALAAYGPVVGLDLDPVRLHMARANAVESHCISWVQADITQAPLAQAAGLFFDPARRSAGRRAFSVRDYVPPLHTVQGWQTPALAVKISPGVQLAELAPYAAQCEIEFISEQGELKECVLWFGALRTAPRRATLLVGDQTHTLTASAELPPSTLAAPLAYVYEPDPAILRAGLVTLLAAQLEAFQLDEEIAYLTSERLTPTPWARAYTIELAMPFQLKRLRAALRERGVGQLTVKKRGSPLSPEALIQQLKPQGPAARIVFLTHVRGEPYALIGQVAGAQTAP